MKAIAFDKHGGLEVLNWMELPEPTLNSGEVLVKVKACALNRLDIWVRQGLPGITIPLPHILGSEITGEIAKVGPGVSGIKAGDRVMISPGTSCGHCEFCARDYDSLCAEYRIMGFQVDGGYAEYAKAPAKSIIKISSKLSYEEWATVPLVFLTAWHMLVTRAALKPGETVLVHAAGSGIGSAAIQLAKWLGAIVLTTAGSEEKLAHAKSLNADHLINYKKQDFAKEARRITQNRGVDVVFEHIGPETWTKSLASLAKGGRLVICGATSGPQATIDLRFLFVKQLSLIGCYMGGLKELLKVLKLVEAGKLRPVLDSTFPLKEAAKAQQRMLNREQFGKIVLVP